MAMSSYMVNSKYVDPKFPPCEEYLQGSYLGEQGADYYSGGVQGADFQPPGLYPRPDFGEQTFGGGGPGPGSALPTRGHGQEPGGPGGHYGAPGEPCPAPPAPPPAPLPSARACSQPGGPKQPPPGTALKQPAVVYPWMKKVHVNSGKAWSSDLSVPTPAWRPGPPRGGASGWGLVGLQWAPQLLSP